MKSEYQIIKFQDLIPMWLERDFAPECYNKKIKHKELVFSIYDKHNQYIFSISKNRERKTCLTYLYYKPSPLETDSIKEMEFDTVTEMYKFLKNKLKQDGCLDKKQRVVKDILC